MVIVPCVKGRSKVNRLRLKNIWHFLVVAFQLTGNVANDDLDEYINMKQ